MKKISLNLIFRSITMLLLISFFAVSCSEIVPPVDPNADLKFKPACDEIIPAKAEFRAAWLSTAWGLDWPQNKRGVDVQKALLKDYFDKLKAININVVLFQVRPYCDALYQSNIYPWSRVLTGTQGVDPGYDPLAYAIELAHERGLELHAWLNPYRGEVATNALISNHPVKTHPQYFVQYTPSGSTTTTNYLNPGLPEVVAHIKEVVMEIVNKYDVDGIHFDDYFYPQGSKSTTNTYIFNDKDAYEQYGGGESLNLWREKNVSRMVKEVNNAIKAAKPHVTFGISPQGTYANAMTVYANPLSWIEDRSIDYLSPQIYWEFGHPTADFDKVIKYWDREAKDMPMVPGLAAYKHGDSRYPAYASPDQLINQVILSRSLASVFGNCWFRSQSIISESVGQAIATNIYSNSAIVPKFGSYTEVKLFAPSVSVSGNTISWGTVSGATQYAVYELTKVGDTRVWNSKLVYLGSNTTFDGESKKNYYVLAVNKRTLSHYQKVVFIR